MPGLTKEQLLSVPVEPVELPQGTAYVRQMSGLERVRFESEYGGKEVAEHATEGDPSWEMLKRIVTLCACDEDGARLFVDEEQAGIDELLRAPAMLALATAALRFNRLRDVDNGELVKNSESSPVNGSH